MRHAATYSQGEHHMNSSFNQAPIGAKVSVGIGFGAHHTGRKFSQTEVIEFSRIRNGWSIVPKDVFSNGKPIHVTSTGRMPTRSEMLSNKQKYADRIYSLGNFNCDDAVEVLNGHQPKSNQRRVALQGATVAGLMARLLLGTGPAGTIVAIGIGAVIALSNANKS